MAVCSIGIIAGPAGAVTNACIEDMNPAGQGNASGLTVACTFVTGADVGLNFTINDAYDATSDGLGPASGAIYHYGAARLVNVTVVRTGPNPGVASGSVIQTCANNVSAVAVVGAGGTCPAPGAAPGNLPLTAADINHSVEFPTSAATLTGLFINPGSFVKAVSATGITLSKPLINAGSPTCTSWVLNCRSKSVAVLVANYTNREAQDATTAVGSGVVTSATAHFCAPTFFGGASSNIGTDVITKAGHVLLLNDKIRFGSVAPTTGIVNGTTYFVVNPVVAGTSFKVSATLGGAPINLLGANNGGTMTVGPASIECGVAPASQITDIGDRLSGGSLPDGATILTVDSIRQVTLTCVACLVGFGNVVKQPDPAALPDPLGPAPIGIDPLTPPTTTRYSVDVTVGGAGNRTLTSVTAKFAKTDVGLPVVFNPALPATTNGLRIGSVDNTTGLTATLVGGNNVAIPAAPATKKITIGRPTKTAPINGDVVGTLAIALTVNPAVSPTSPPCAAGKVSGFHIPWQWRNPGFYLFADNNTTHVEGHGIVGTTIAQLAFVTASTSFAGFIKQAVTVAGGIPTTAGYLFKIEFAPIAVGVCSTPPTPVAETFSMIGISASQAAQPTFTGGGGGGTRALGPIPDSHSVHFGSPDPDGVNVSTGGSNPTDDNTCDLDSPNVIQIGCR